MDLSPEASTFLSPQLHRNMSWAANHDVGPVMESDEIDMAPSSSPATSDSDSLLSANVTTSQGSSPDTAPSSYAETSEIAVRSKVVPTLPKETYKHATTPNPTTVQRETLESTPVASRTQLSQQPPTKTPGPRTPKQPSTSSGTPTQQGLWSKIKSNVKRPSSRGGVDPETPGSERKSKDKGMLGGMFSSASKGLLSQSSTRSLAAGTHIELKRSSAH